MVCNGNNHPKDCKCNFRGGHPHLRPPVWHGWSARTARRSLSGPNAQCPECRASVYFVQGKHGGGTYFDQLGPPWPKHPCTDTSKKYSVYSKSGKPKLRVKPSEFEKDRWLPFIVRHIERLGIGTIVHGLVLDNPTLEHLGILSKDFDPDTYRPIFFRTTSIADTIAELNYFKIGSDEIVSRSLYRDCRNEFELLIK
jgi:hypothetical protein